MSLDQNVSNTQNNIAQEGSTFGVEASLMGASVTQNTNNINGGLGIPDQPELPIINEQGPTNRINNQNNGNTEMQAFYDESQPFKHAILDTLESQPFNAFNMGHQAPPLMAQNNVPNFGSLLQPGPQISASIIGGDKPQWDKSLQPYQINQNQMSVTSNTSPIVKNPSQIRVVLDCFNQKEIILGCPLKYENDDPQTGNILIKPILEYIKNLGKPIHNQSISYFSEEDALDVFVGIEGYSIDETKCVALDELGTSNKVKLLLTVKQPQDVVQPLPNHYQSNKVNQNIKHEGQQQNQGAKPQDQKFRDQEEVANQPQQETLVLSLPPMETETQYEKAVLNVIQPPPKKFRNKKSDIVSRESNKVSENVINKLQSDLIQDTNMEKQNQNDANDSQHQSQSNDEKEGSINNQGNVKYEQDDMSENVADQQSSSDGQSGPGSRNASGSKANGASKTKLEKLQFAAEGGVTGGRDKKATHPNAAVPIPSSRSGNTARVNIKPGDDEQQKKRTKERTITEIIEKVSTWRKLYNGVLIPNNQTNQAQLQRWSLEDAAAKVKVSKKSLDDYLLQLRFGKKFGFDFEKNRNSKVGVLRSFVKEMKDKHKRETGGGAKLSSKSPLPKDD